MEKNIISDERVVMSGDVVRVEFVMKVDHITRGVKEEAQIFGFTPLGHCVSAPLDSVKEKIQ